MVAVNTDEFYIVTYAEDPQFQKDVSDGFLLYHTVRFNPSSLSDEVNDIAAYRVPNRMNISTY